MSEPRPKLRVLIVEDSRDDFDLMVRELERGGFEVETLRVDDEPSMRAALESRAWDAVLADYVARLNALNRARRYREDFFQLRRVCQRHADVAFADAGAFGETYIGMDHYSARDLAREGWRENLWEANRHAY